MYLLFTVARDRDSDSEDCYILVVLFFILSRPPTFRRPWADFRETLPHDAIWLCGHVHTKHGGVPHPPLRSAVPLVCGVGQVNFESI